MSPNACDTSVIVCTKDRPEALADCLRSLGRQSVQPAEIVLVVGSATSLPKDVSECAGDVPVSIAECFGENLSASRNAGIAASKGSIVLFIDDDAIARRDWLEQMLAVLSESPRVWAAGGHVYDARTKPRELEFAHGTVSLTGRQSPVLPATPRRLPAATFLNVKGCNFGVVRRRVEALGGFDEFFAFAFDEADLMVRIARAGGEIRHAPQAVVDHTHVPGLHRRAHALDRGWRVEFASHLFFCLRHAGAVRRVMGRCVVEGRRFKLLSHAALSLLRGQLGVSRVISIARETRAGIRAAVAEDAARSPASRMGGTQRRATD